MVLGGARPHEAIRERYVIERAWRLRPCAWEQVRSKAGWASAMDWLGFERKRKMDFPFRNFDLGNLGQIQKGFGRESNRDSRWI